MRALYANHILDRKRSTPEVVVLQPLSVASVIGREFQLEVLRRVYARPDEELESALDEAVVAAMVAERSAAAATITAPIVDRLRGAARVKNRR
jgi:hypothetical protein